jgi:hypothetical protein
VHVPVVNNVMWLPFVPPALHTNGVAVVVNDTGKPDVAVADAVTGDAANVTSGNAGNVIVWSCFCGGIVVVDDVVVVVVVGAVVVVVVVGAVVVVVVGAVVVLVVDVVVVVVVVVLVVDVVVVVVVEVDVDELVVETCGASGSWSVKNACSVVSPIVPPDTRTWQFLHTGSVVIGAGSFGDRQ